MPAQKPRKDSSSATPPSDDAHHKERDTEFSKTKRKYVSDYSPFTPLALSLPCLSFLNLFSLYSLFFPPSSRRQSQSCMCLSFFLSIPRLFRPFSPPHPSNTPGDACRARKVRCARENPEDQKQSCKHCISLQIPCTYEYQPKKRGPPNLYLRRRQEEEAIAQQKRELEARELEPNDESCASPTSTSPSQPPFSPTLIPKSPFIEPSVPITPSRYPIAADQYHPHYPPTYHSPRATEPINTGTNGSTRQEDSYSPPSAHSDFNPSAYPLYNNPHNTSNWSYRNPTQPQSPAHLNPHSVLPTSPLPSLSYNYRPHRLESIIPRDTVSLIIALFFDFVYPLTPCIHKPSFMADLHARREERDPLFFALVMSTVASTLVQVPRSYLPMERSVVRKLAQNCHEASRHITIASYDPPTSMHVVIRYL